MNTFFKKWRKQNLNNIGKYLLYALGEILLIIIGILIAVNINERQTTKKENILRCQYLEELSFAFDHDIDDVKENIAAFEKRNPKIKELVNAISEKKVNELDSLVDKINNVSKYVFFVQQSKSKIEELKYSNINLINDRNLKNRILFYQESKIVSLMDQERRFNIVNEDVRQYFVQKNSVFNIEDLENDKYFASIAYQKYNYSEGMRENYEYLLKEQYEIKKLIEEELDEKCRK